MDTIIFKYKMMKKFLTAILFLCTLQVSAQETLTIRNINPYTWNSTGVPTMEFRSNQDPGLPLIIFAHGVGEGTPAKIYNNGLPKVLKNGFKPPYPVVILAPMQSGGWVPANWMPQLIRRAYELYKIDTNRVIITGLSAGGSTVWESALNINQEFLGKIAALIPVSAYFANANQTNIPWFKATKTPVWAVVGGSTTDGTEFSFREGNLRLADKINAQVPSLVKVSVRTGLGHCCSEDVYNGTYKDGTFEFWSFIKDKRTGGTTIPPVVVTPIVKCDSLLKEKENQIGLLKGQLNTITNQLNTEISKYEALKKLWNEILDKLCLNKP